MSWIFDNIGLIVFFIIAFSVVRKIRALLRRMESDTERRTQARPIANYDPEEARRVREIQEEIRRKIAERRGGGAQPPPISTARPFLEEPPSGTSPIDPFGGPGRKILAELERRLQAPPPLPPAVYESRQAQMAQLERQEELAEQMRVLEESRIATQRRANKIAAALKNEAESERGMLAASRGSLLTDLRDPRSLRRAFVLREVLGPPVGLRW